MINAKAAQWMILTHIKDIRMRTDSVPAELRRVFFLLEPPLLFLPTHWPEQAVTCKEPNIGSDSRSIMSVWVKQLHENQEYRASTDNCSMSTYMCVCVFVYMCVRKTEMELRRWRHLFIKMSCMESGDINHSWYIIRKLATKCWQGSPRKRFSSLLLVLSQLNV